MSLNIDIQNDAKALETMGMRTRTLAIICSKGSLDMAYPALILADAARTAGVEIKLFFMFWGLDVVNRKKVDHLHMGIVGNPSIPIPAMVAGLPGVEAMATHWMIKEIDRLEIPRLPQMLEDLEKAGAEIYACALSMEMFRLELDDLVPQVKEVITSMDFLEMADEAQLIFV